MPHNAGVPFIGCYINPMLFSSKRSIWFFGEGSSLLFLLLLCSWYSNLHFSVNWQQDDSLGCLENKPLPPTYHNDIFRWRVQGKKEMRAEMHLFPFPDSFSYPLPSFQALQCYVEQNILTLRLKYFGTASCLLLVKIKNHDPRVSLRYSLNSNST